MSLSCSVGGARGTFQEPEAAEVAGLLDRAFGAEDGWESPPRPFGDLSTTWWADLRRLACAELGADALPNLLAPDDSGRGVYLPAHIQAVSLPLSAGAPLRCASLPGLRAELAELAARRALPLDDPSLLALLETAPDHDDRRALLAFARLALAANEAVRRGCPLWLVG